MFTIAQCLSALNCTWEEFGLTYDAVVKTKNLTTRDIPLCSMSLVATLIQHGTAIQSAASFSTALPGAHLFACFVEDASMPPLTPGDVFVIAPDKTGAPDAFVLVSRGAAAKSFAPPMPIVGTTPMYRLKPWCVPPRPHVIVHLKNLKTQTRFPPRCLAWWSPRRRGSNTQVTPQSRHTLLFFTLLYSTLLYSTLL